MPYCLRRSIVRLVSTVEQVQYDISEPQTPAVPMAPKVKVRVEVEAKVKVNE